MSVPPVAIELNTNIAIKTASAYEAPAEPKAKRVATTPLGRGATEQKVREYFADVPIMIVIARCESEFTQHNPQTGEVFRGWMNPRDLGVMQINEHYHGETAEVLNLNIYTLEGNLAYARYLYQSQGTQPWSASRPCWGSSSLALN